MSLTSLEVIPLVSPGALTLQIYTPLSHHITSLITRSASVQTMQTYMIKFNFLCCALISEAQRTGQHSSIHFHLYKLKGHQDNILLILYFCKNDHIMKMKEEQPKKKFSYLNKTTNSYCTKHLFKRFIQVLQLKKQKTKPPKKQKKQNKSHLGSSWGELTVLDGNLPFLVLCSQYRLVASSFLDHSAYCPVTVWTVI